MSEADKILLLLELFGWPNDRDWRFQALTILRSARGEPYPLPDDFE